MIGIFSLWTVLLAGPASAAEWPDIDTPVKTGARARGDAAVVIGVERYPFLTDVPYAERDAEAFYDYLLYTRGVPSDQIQALYGASAEAIRAAVAAAATEVREDGVLWVYYAGHGGGDPSSGERLLVGDTAKSTEAEFAAGSVSVSELRSLAAAGGSEVVLVVDACYNGLGRDGAQYGSSRFSVPTYTLERAARISEWTAAGPGELASPLDAVRHGAFTYFALGALRGWADGELDGQRDGRVSPEEAQVYVEKALRTVGRRDQHPELALSDGLIELSRGRERAPEIPGLTASVVASLPPGGAGIALGDSTDLVRLAAEVKAAGERTTALKVQLSAEREQRFRVASAAVLSQASADWVGIADVVSSGLPEAQELVETFVRKYGEAQVTLDSESRPVEVPELEEALPVLAELREAAEAAAAREERAREERARRERSEGGRGLSWVADGLLLGGSVAFLSVGGVTERNIQETLQGGGGYDISDEALQVKVNALYTSGYVAMGAGLALGTGLVVSQPMAGGGALGFRWSGSW